MADQSGSWWQILLGKLGIQPVTSPQPSNTADTAALSPEEAQAYEDLRNSLNVVFDNESNREPTAAETSVTESTLRSAEAPTLRAVPLPISRPGQLLNLPDPKGIARYTITGRVWPNNLGEASICMWKDDKLAAFSLTIDDNHIQDHPFWTQLCDEFGFKATWFVIGNQVSWQNESWANWQALLNAGHDIQSHGYSHLCDAMFYIQREYRQSVEVMMDNLKDAQVVTHAYPFGFKTNKVGSRCECIKTLNDRAEAAKYFLAARDVIGAIAAINKVDFMAVPSISNLRNFFNSTTTFAYFDSIFDVNNKINYRAWYCGHMHHLPDQATKDYMRQVFQHLKKKSADVWVGTFTQIAKYAQQYATAKISNLTVQNKQIRFEVTDQMYDGWFNFPLTIKIRLDTSWGTNLKAVQNGKIIPVQVITYVGAPYALVDAVPDAGLVIVTPA
ncbi:polysaccharide deacetylase family protein [Thiofilum flexile]|uniref:polysaccharide deacetylase family protein n=1 Tax=Thiofilum flexile TaxID=125627 RepID=UPI000362869B|nr:polysaccharide deacetylase family protein [Thiofilum flexile]